MNNICFEFGKTGRNRGSITRKKGSRMLYVSFSYLGRRIEKSSGLPDTSKNRTQLKDWLDRVMQKIDDGSFRFAEAFPGASDEEKSFFAKQEGWEFMPEPHKILMGDYIKNWKENILPTFPSENKKRDYLQSLEDWIIPYVSDKTFFQFTRVEVQKFISNLKWRKGVKVGQPLSRSRIRNILIPLRAIWLDACDEYRWSLPDPFVNQGRNIPKSPRVRREVFRFDDWKNLIDHLDPYFRPVTELMILTGLIASEVAGLRPSDIEGDYIQIRNSLVRGHEKSDLKTAYRERKIFITESIRLRLEEALTRSKGPYLFTMKTGIPFREGSFRQNYWKPAFEAAGLDYKVPYTTRHSFAAWSLTMGIDPNRLVSLMGHGSKKMIYEVYGNYVDGLEEDREKMLNYFGQDFRTPKNKRHNLVELREWRKFGESRQLSNLK